MAVVISEIVTEIAVAPAPAGGEPSQLDPEDVVRRATERVLEILRREWDL